MCKGGKKMYDLQKASMWKRISAWLFDFIMIAILTVGVAYILTTVLSYDSYADRFNSIKEKYATEYGVDLSVTDTESLSEQEKENYEKADAAFAADKEAAYAFRMLINLAFIITTFSILLAFVVLEFVVPLLFGNGQTLGKKIFGIGVMREDGVKVSPVLVFTRAILGKCTLETLVPVLTIVMMIFGIIGIMGPLILFALLIIEIALMAATKGNQAIHDKLSYTATVDMASQLIFDTPEALLEYKKRIHAEESENKEY